MTELRLYLRRGSLRGNDDCSWVLRGEDGRTLNSGNTLAGMPAAGRCHLVLAADLVSVLPVRLPDLPARKLTALLPGAAEAHTLGDAEQLHVCLLERDASGMTWLAVIDREWLQFTLERLASLGMRIDAALPEFLLLPLEPGAWSLLRHEEGTLLRVSSSFGLALDLGDPPAGLQLMLDRAADGQERRPQRLCLFQGDAVRPPDVDAWSKAGGVQIDLRGKWGWRDPAWPLCPNLMSGRFFPGHSGFEWSRLLRPALLGVALLAFIQVAGVFIDWMRLSREERGLREEMARVATSVLPPGARVVDPAWQVRELLKSSSPTHRRDGGGMIALMGAAGRLRPADGAAELRLVTYEEGRLNLEFARVEAGWLDRYVASLSADGLRVSREPAGEGNVRLAIEFAGAVDRGGALGR